MTSPCCGDSEKLRRNQFVPVSRAMSGINSNERFSAGSRFDAAEFVEARMNWFTSHAVTNAFESFSFLPSDINCRACKSSAAKSFLSSALATVGRNRPASTMRSAATSNSAARCRSAASLPPSPRAPASSFRSKGSSASPRVSKRLSNWPSNLASSSSSWRGAISASASTSVGTSAGAALFAGPWPCGCIIGWSSCGESGGPEDLPAFGNSLSK